MQAVQTRYARIADLPLGAADAWLSPAEQARLRAMRSERRQRGWLAGRIVLKRLLLAVLPLPAGTRGSDLHIDSQSPRAGHGDRPLAWLAGEPLTCSLALAHSDSAVLAAVSLHNEQTLGVDLVRPASAAAVQWTFTERERRWLAQSPCDALAAERVWAMKEAFYKACQRGEGFTPQAIDVAPGATPRYEPFDIAGELLALQCWRVDGHLAALAVARAVQTDARLADWKSKRSRAA